MERVQTLIKRLLDQYETNTDTAHLLLTAQMLVHELQEKNNNNIVTGKNISVILPSSKPLEIKQAEISSPISEEIPVLKEETVLPVPAKEIIKEKEKEVYKPVIPVPRMEEIPTFTYQQKEGFDLNDSITSNGQTLNDRLKTEKKELGSLLKESPVKDLKKAIGINDRFVFIDELFRGDENMYERSIKTINGFSILAEAEFWIQRELKLKLGWDESSSTVIHFDQLVRRRFS